MLKTNSKKAVENVRKYIIANYHDEEQDTKQNAQFEEIAKAIYNAFVREKWIFEKRRYTPKQKAFEDWAQGLPSILDVGYYYNREAKADLQAILEETDREANKYSESQAQATLTYLIYREIKKAVERGAK